MVHLGEVGPTVWDDIMDELERKLADTGFQRANAVPDWRKLAHRRKFEREAFANYGYLKDFVLHPKVQVVKHYVEENARLNDVFVGEPFTSTTNIVVLSFMLYRRVDNFVLTLVAAFLFNVNPVYVAMAAILLLFMKKGRLPKGYINRKRNFSAESKPISLKAVKQLDSTKFDDVLIGWDVATYFAAAVLSRCGHKCVIIEPSDCPTMEINHEQFPCPAPVASGFVSKVDRYQPLLDAVKSKESPHRVVFAPLGTAENGFTNAVIRMIAPAQTLQNPLGATVHRKAYTTTLYSRPGEHALVHYLCSALSIEKSKLVGSFERIRSLWQFFTAFLYSRCVKEAEWQKSAVSTNPFTKQFQDIIESSLQQYLLNCEIPEGKVHDALHALASSIGAQESLPRHKLSSFAFGMTSQFAESGAFVPVGGIPALIRMLRAEICSVGGMVVTDVESIKLEVNAVAGSTTSYKVTGVAVSGEGTEEQVLTGERSVISGLGLLSTYSGLLSSDIVTNESKVKLATLEEAKPKIKVVFWLQGSCTALGLSNTDFYQVQIKPPVTTKDDVQTETETETTEAASAKKLVGEYVHVWSPSAQNPDWPHEQTHVVVVEMEVKAPFVTKVAMDFADGTRGPAFYVDARNEESDPNDPMFAERLCRRLKLTRSKESDFIRVADGIVRQLFPRITGPQILQTHVEAPVLGGSRLANTTSKFATSLSAHTELQNFYLTGADLSGTGLTGDIQSGILTANAVLGYSLTELSEGRSAIQDIR